MSLVKYYLTLLDFVRKTVKGTIDKKDFDKAFDAFIEISLYARKFGKQNSAMKEMYRTYEDDKEKAENLYKTAKSKSVKNELDCLNYTKEILDNASKGELLAGDFSNVLCSISSQNKHYDNLGNIDDWTYEREGY